MPKTCGAWPIRALACSITVQEANKGDKLHQEAHDLLAAAPGINFIGNVESSNILNGPADVVVTDGFTGNATLKAIEGTVHTVTYAKGRDL